MKTISLLLIGLTTSLIFSHAEAVVLTVGETWSHEWGPPLIGGYYLYDSSGKLLFGKTIFVGEEREDEIDEFKFTNNFADLVLTPKKIGKYVIGFCAGNEDCSTQWSVGFEIRDCRTWPKGISCGQRIGKYNDVTTCQIYPNNILVDSKCGKNGVWEMLGAGVIRDKYIFNSLVHTISGPNSHEFLILVPKSAKRIHSETVIRIASPYRTILYTKCDTPTFFVNGVKISRNRGFTNVGLLSVANTKDLVVVGIPFGIGRYDVSVSCKVDTRVSVILDYCRSVFLSCSVSGHSTKTCPCVDGGKSVSVFCNFDLTLSSFDCPFNKDRAKLTEISYPNKFEHGFLITIKCPSPFPPVVEVDSIETFWSRELIGSDDGQLIKNDRSVGQFLLRPGALKVDNLVGLTKIGAFCGDNYVNSFTIEGKRCELPDLTFINCDNNNDVILTGDKIDCNCRNGFENAKGECKKDSTFEIEIDCQGSENIFGDQSEEAVDYNGVFPDYTPVEDVIVEAIGDHNFTFRVLNQERPKTYTHETGSSSTRDRETGEVRSRRRRSGEIFAPEVSVSTLSAKVIMEIIALCIAMLFSGKLCASKFCSFWLKPFDWCCSKLPDKCTNCCKNDTEEKIAENNIKVSSYMSNV